MKVRASAQGALGKVVLWSIIVALSFFGFGAFTSFVADEPAVAAINGKTIYAGQLQREIDRQRANASEADEGESDEVVTDRALEQLILLALLDQAAEEARLTVSEQKVDDAITEDETFFDENGAYSPDVFTSLLRNVGQTPGSYRRLVASGLLRQQLVEGVANTGFATSWEVDNEFRLSDEKRDVAWLEFDWTKWRDAEDVTEEAIADYYHEHISEYQSPLQIVVHYLELRLSELEEQLTISEEDLRNAYEREASDLISDETRQAAHILLNLDENMSEEQARSKLLGFREQVENGEAKFPDLARDHSQDPGSAAQGGDLGNAGKGTYVPEFEEALWALSENEISDPVKTQFGVHLIQLLKINESAVPEFADLRADLEKKLLQERAESLYTGKKRALAEKGFEAGDLQLPAETLGLEIKTSDPLSQDGAEDGLFSYRTVIDAIFGSEVLEDGYNSPVLEPESGWAVLLRAAEKLEPRQLLLEDVKDDIREILIEQNARSHARELANAAAQSLNDGDSGRGVAARYELDWQREEGLERSGNQDVPEEVRKLAFSMTKPVENNKTVGVAEYEEGTAVVAVTLVKPGDIQELNEEQQKTQRRIRTYTQASSDFKNFQALLEHEADVVIEDALDGEP